MNELLETESDPCMQAIDSQYAARALVKTYTYYNENYLTGCNARWLYRYVSNESVVFS